MTVYREGPTLDGINQDAQDWATQFAKRAGWKSVSSVTKKAKQLGDNPHGWDCPCDGCEDGRKEVLKDQGVLPSAIKRPKVAPRYTEDDIDRIHDSYYPPEN